MVPGLKTAVVIPRIGSALLLRYASDRAAQRRRQRGNSGAEGEARMCYKYTGLVLKMRAFFNCLQSFRIEGLKNLRFRVQAKTCEEEKLQN
jgi:hypothetical protein